MSAVAATRSTAGTIPGRFGGLDDEETGSPGGEAVGTLLLLAGVHHVLIVASGGSGDLAVMARGTLPPHFREGCGLCHMWPCRSVAQAARPWDRSSRGSR